MSNALFNRVASLFKSPLERGDEVFAAGKPFEAFGFWKIASEAGEARADFLIGKLFEDGYAAFRYYYASRSVVCLPGLYYFYLTRSNSITTSSLSVKNLDGLDAEVDSVDFLKEKGCLDLLAKAQTKYFAAVIRSLKRFDLNQQNVSLKFKEINKDFRRLYPDIRKNPLLSKKEKFTAALFKISPRLCKLLIRVKKL